MTLQINTKQLQIILNHAKSDYPQECCGVLLGRITPSAHQVHVVRPTVNTWNDQTGQILCETAGIDPRDGGKATNFTIDPKELLQVQKEARGQNLEIIGIYHSHPDHQAIPSEFDRAIAWPEYAYLIISVIQGQAKEYYSWRLDEKQQFLQDPLNEYS